MEQKPIDSNTTGLRKVRFQPKAPTRKATKPIVKREVVDDKPDAQAMDVLRRLSESSLKPKPKFERKSDSMRYPFGGRGASTSSMKSDGIFKDEDFENKYESPFGGYNPSSRKKEKEYADPWDYYSNYPTSLPLRRPYSGDPALLDVDEFGGASETITYDENSINSARELGLMEENLDGTKIFLKLPPTMPITKQLATAKGTADSSSANAEGAPSSSSKIGNGAASSSKPLRGGTGEACNPGQLPAGFMGKMLVYKSGAIKLKLGDTLYDVTPGVNSEFAQDVVAVNVVEKNFCVVGELNKHASITPDIDSILNSMVLGDS